MIELAWPIVALVAIAAASTLVSRYAATSEWRQMMAERAGNVLRAVAALEERIDALEAGTKTTDAVVSELRKRVESGELRKLGGVR